MKTQEKTRNVKSVLAKALAAIVLVVFVVLAAIAVEKRDSIMGLFADKTTESEATNEGGETQSRSTGYQEIYNFAYTGGQQVFTAPTNGTYKLQVWGAQGGYRSNTVYGGKGGYATGNITLEEGETVYIYVGGAGRSGGYNGGGSRSGYYGGGGATDIRIQGTSLYNRVIVAGGGGSDGAPDKPGYYGGGEIGGSATEYYGSGGVGASTTAAGGYRGSFGQGGSGTNGSGGTAGAGGGGWYGGGGSDPDGSRDDDRGGRRWIWFYLEWNYICS